MAGNATSTVLLTGGTGFLGGAASVETLLRQPGCRILFLVRDRATATAETRLHRSLSRFADSVPLDDAWLRCEVMRGDLTAPQTLTDPLMNDSAMRPPGRLYGARGYLNEAAAPLSLEVANGPPRGGYFLGRSRIPSSARARIRIRCAQRRAATAFRLVALAPG